jgi:hypothetical protein
MRAIVRENLAWQAGRPGLIGLVAITPSAVTTNIHCAFVVCLGACGEQPFDTRLIAAA